MVWMSRQERIARTADSWVARSAGSLSPDERTERDRWRAADPAHENAWKRAQGLMTTTAGMRRPAEASHLVTRPIFRPVYALAALAAVIAAGGGALILQKELGSAGRPARAMEYAAAASARHVRLADGTLVDLDPGSAMRADYSGPIRAVLVERGTARFDVAHDSTHPFVVSAADRKVTAIGTRFEVALRADGMVVTLFQGAIEVARMSGTPSARPVRMTHGQRLSVTAGRQVLTSVPVNALPVQGVQDVDPTPVSNIVAWANLTATVPIRLASPDLGARRVEGRFDLSNTAALAEQLGAALDLVVSKTGNAYILSSR
jgi:transmembrane sensor